MNNKNLLLLRTMLKSSSQLNILKYTKDKKKKNQIIGNFVGMSFAYVALIAFCVLTCIGYGMAGIADCLPLISGMTICTLSFVFTVFKSNGYLFNFKEYDMIISLPFGVKDVAASKFLYMYVKSLPWYASLSLAMMIGYGYFMKPSVLVYPVWIILSLMLPVIPMLLASVIGYFIAKATAGMKLKNIFQTILIMIVLVFCFCLRFIIEAIFKNGQVEESLENISGVMDQTATYYVPLSWFAHAVNELKVGDMLLLAGTTILLFELVFLMVGCSYRQINSAMVSHGSSKAYEMTSQKRKSILNTIAYKEFKRMTGSPTYMTNSLFGILMIVLLGIVSLVVGIDHLIETFLQEAPITKEMLYPAIPVIIYFFSGMVPTTAVTPSLEGKNYWIVQSLPISKKNLYQGKILFNLYMTIPPVAFATVCLCISARTPLFNTILYLVEGIILCVFSTAWGCVCGVKHMRLDWENEIEVIKQGAAVTIYLLPNMFITMGLCVLVVVLGQFMNSNLVSLLLTFIAGVLAILSYLKVLSLAKK